MYQNAEIELGSYLHRFLKRENFLEELREKWLASKSGLLSKPARLKACCQK
jgi:hypothetical protein